MLSTVNSESTLSALFALCQPPVSNAQDVDHSNLSRLCWLNEVRLRHSKREKRLAKVIESRTGMNVSYSFQYMCGRLRRIFEARFDIAELRKLPNYLRSESSAISPASDFEGFTLERTTSSN